MSTSWPQHMHPVMHSGATDGIAAVTWV